MKSFLYLLLAIVCLSSCQKDGATAALQGTYKGSLRNASADPSYLLSSNVLVTISGSGYQCSSSAAPNSRGSYTFSKNQLNFSDTLAHTANFNANLLLNGSYRQSAKGDSLVWTKTLGSFNYIYTLKKQ